MKQIEKQQGSDIYSKLKENTNPSSKLVKRLYRNSSLNRFNSNVSLLSSYPNRDLEGSILNHSSSNNQLVASISLKKFKKNNISERSLEISNGKIMITQHHENSSFRNYDLLPKKKMFKKLDKLDSSQNNKILPDDLIDFPIENQGFPELKPLKKVSHLSKSGKKSKAASILQNQHEDLLPQDFIQLLREDKCITNQFCYLKKMDHPYDLKIIDFESNFPKTNNEVTIGRNVPTTYPDQYITISSRGITYFGKQQSRIVPLEEWKKQAEQFKKIMKLNFFKNYKIIKNFGNWKKFIRKSSMKSIIEKLKDQLVVNDRFLRNSLLQTRDRCFSMETDVSYCKFDECQNVMTFREFKQSQQFFIQNEFENKINEIEEDIKGVLIKNMSASMKQFKEQNKISSGMQGKGMPLLIGDQKNLDMPYTKQATLRTQQEKFKKFVKLVDLLITHSKVNMMHQSTQIFAKKINQENQSYQKQVIDSKYKHTYKGKQYLQCKMNLENEQQTYTLKPTQEQLGSLFEDIINRSVIKLCRNHKKITQDMDILSIIYDNTEEFPKESDSSILKVIMTSDDRQEKMISKIMKEVTNSYHYIEEYAEKYVSLISIYFTNTKKFENIDNLTSRDHQTIKNYIQSWRNQLQKINQITPDHQSALFLLNLKDFKSKATKMTLDCINKIKEKLPNIFEKSIQEMTKNLSNALIKMDNKPIGIQSYILFQNNKSSINSEIQEYSDQVLEINCLWNLMRNIWVSNLDSSNMKKQERESKELSSMLQNVRKKIDEAEMNGKVYETRAQKEVKQMVPKSKSRIVELYNKITALGREERDTSYMVSFIDKKSEELKSITAEMLDIRNYQKFLDIEEYSGEDIETFTTFFNTFQQVWQTRDVFENYWQKKIMQTAWGNINTSDINHKFEEFITTMLALQKTGKRLKKEDLPYQLSNHDMKSISYVIEVTQKQKPLVETIQCLNDKFLTDKEWKQIKSSLESRSEHGLGAFLQKDRYQTTTKQLLGSSIVNELSYLKNIVYKAKKQNDIVIKHENIKFFWKAQVNVCRNLLDNFSDTYNNLMKELEDNLILANSIFEDPTERSRVKRDKQMLERLRDILILWNEHEKYVSYFEPIYSCLDWKMTKEGKVYSSAQQNWKKTIKQYKDTQLHKLANNDKLINLLQENNEIFQGLYEYAYSHINVKRSLYPRLFFLSNKEIIQLYSENKDKDFQSLNKMIRDNVGNGKIFCHLKELSIKENEPFPHYPHEVINLDGEVLALKIGRANGSQVEQLLRILQESMKSSIKTNLKTCYQAFDTELFNKYSWVSEYPLQVLLFIDKVYFTKIIQYDYLIPSGQDLSRLLFFHLSQIQYLRNMFAEAETAEMKKKITILLTQSLHTRDIISYLNENKVQSYDEFHWLKQIRHYYNAEIAYTDYLVTSITYGNQFVSLFSNPIAIHNLNQKALIQFANTVITSSTIPISNKSASYEFATYNAKNYAKLQLTNGDDPKCLQNFIMGTWLTSSITDIMMSKYFGEKSFQVISKLMKEIHLALSHRETYLRGSKSLTINKESGILLIPHPGMEMANLANLRVDYRQLNIPKVSFSQFLVTLFQIHNFKNRKDLCCKLARLIKYIEETFSISIISIKELKVIVEESIEFCDEAYDIEEMIKEKLIYMIEKKINNSKISKFMVSVINEEIVSTSLNRTLMRKITNKLIGDKLAHQIIVRGIVQKMKSKRVCILTGEQNHTKELIVQKLAQQYAFRSCKNENLQKNYIVIKDQNIDNLIGFRTPKNNWVSGYLSNLIVKGKDNSTFILKGKVTQKILQVFQKIQQNKFFLQNGDKVQIPPTMKFIINADNDYYDFDDDIKMGCVVFDGEEWVVKNQETFQFTLFKNSKTQNIKAYQEGYTSLSNIFVNNYEKILSNLKLIGFKNQYIEGEFIMERFVKIVSCIMARDQEKYCLKNIKMLEKVYFWSMYWSISPGIPSTNILRFDKILFDTVKTQVDRSQKLSQTNFVISQRMQTICKSIKEDIFLQVEKTILKVGTQSQAKVQYVNLLLQNNNPIMLIGNKGAGKSTFLFYLQYKFIQNKLNHYSFLNISMHNKMDLDQFLGLIMTKSFIRSTVQDNNQTYHLSSVNGNKLVVFIDNINLIDRNNRKIIEFLQTVLTYGYYFDFQTNKHNKIFLHNISFVFAQNSSCQPLDYHFLLSNCFPIYIDEFDLKELVQCYKQKIVEEKEERQGIFKVSQSILQSTVTLHYFITNIIETSKTIQKYELSTSTPIWIICEIIQKYSSYEDIVEYISLWKYLCVQKYINAGIQGIQVQQTLQIQNEINNLVNLMLKNTQNIGIVLESQKQFIRQILNETPIVDMGDYKNYYLHLMYIMKAHSSRHILKGYQRMHPQAKETVLKRVCEKVGKEYVRLTSILQLTNNNKNCVVYVPANSHPQLIQICLIYIINQNRLMDKMSFVVDLDPKMNMLKLISKYPAMVDNIQVYSDEKNINYARGCPSAYKQLIGQLQGSQNMDGAFLMQVCYLINTMQSSLKYKIQYRLNKLQIINNNFQQLKTIIRTQSEEIIERKKEIEQLTVEEQKMMAQKNSLVKELKGLKEKESTDPKDKQAINKSISNLDGQLQKVKRKKNTMQEMVKKVETSSQNQSTYTLLSSKIAQYKHDYQQCQIIKNKTPEVILINILFIIYHRNQRQQPYIPSIIQNITNKVGLSLQTIYTLLLSTPITNIHTQYSFVLWYLYDKCVTFLTDHQQDLVQELCSKFPQLKYCSSQYDVGQYAGNTPILTNLHLPSPKPYASMIKPIQNRSNSKEQIEYNCQKSPIQQFRNRLCQRIDIGRANEIVFGRRDMNRFITQQKLLQHKLKNKLQSKPQLFRTKNQAAEVKQLYEASKSLKDRVVFAQQRISRINKQKQEQFGQVYEYSSLLYRYIMSMQRLCPYAQITQKTYLTIIQNSITQHKQPSSSQIQQKEQEPKEDNAQQLKGINMEQTKRKILKNCYNWISIMLVNKDALYSYFLLASYVQYHQQQISNTQLQLIQSVLVGDCSENKLRSSVGQLQWQRYANNSSNSKDQEEQTQQNISVNRILYNIFTKNNNKYNIMIKYSESVLNYNFKANILYNKTDIIEQMFELTSTREKQKIVVGLGSEQYNSLKIIDKQIYKIKTQEEIILTFSQQQHINHLIQTIEKLPPNQQIWLVLWNWYNTNNINNMFSYLQNKQTTNHINIFVLFDNIPLYTSIKHNIKFIQKKNSFIQIAINNKENNICYSLLKMLSKFNVKNSSNDLNKLLKMVYFDKVNMVMKQLMQGQYKLKPHDYRLTQLLLKKYSKIGINSVVQFALQHLYNSTEKIFPRQAKKQFKIYNIPDYSQDNCPIQAYNLINQTYQQLKKKLQSQQHVSNLFNAILPQSQHNKIPTDILYQFEEVDCSTKAQPILQQQYRSVVEANRIQYLEEVQDILNKIPVLNKQQKGNKIISYNLHKSMLKNQKNKLQRLYKKNFNTIRKAKKLLINNKTISDINLTLIKDIINNNQHNRLINQMIEIEKNIQTLDGLVQRKQNIKYAQFEFIKNPKAFLYALMYEGNTQKLDWSSVELVCKCFSDKEKELFLEKEFICLNNLYVVNGKFDHHKTIIENGNEGSQQKLNSNVFVFFRKEEPMNLNFKKFSFMHDQKEVIGINVMAKVKEPGIWDKSIHICQQKQ